MSQNNGADKGKHRAPKRQRLTGSDSDGVKDTGNPVQPKENADPLDTPRLKREDRPVAFVRPIRRVR